MRGMAGDCGGTLRKKVCLGLWFLRRLQRQSKTNIFPQLMYASRREEILFSLI